MKTSSSLYFLLRMLADKYIKNSEIGKSPLGNNNNNNGNNDNYCYSDNGNQWM